MSRNRYAERCDAIHAVAQSVLRSNMLTAMGRQITMEEAKSIVLGRIAPQWRKFISPSWTDEEMWAAAAQQQHDLADGDQDGYIRRLNKTWYWVDLSAHLADYD